MVVLVDCQLLQSFFVVVFIFDAVVVIATVTFSGTNVAVITAVVTIAATIIVF